MIKMITPTNFSAKALQPNSSPDDPRRSLSAEDQKMPVTITRRLRFIIASPRWRLAALISMMLFVASSAPPKFIQVNGAGDVAVNVLYARQDPKARLPDGEDGLVILYAQSEWQKKIGDTCWYKADNGHYIHFDRRFRHGMWNLCGPTGSNLYWISFDLTQPPPTGWQCVRNHYKALEPAPTLVDVSSTKEEETLVAIIRTGMRTNLPPSDMAGWMKTPDRRRRLLTSEPAGYGSPPNDGWGPSKEVSPNDASARRHIHRLLASEAADHAC